MQSDVGERYIKANWTVPKDVHAYTTTRLGGWSQNQYSSFNLAMHVNEDVDIVKRNRQTLLTDLSLPSEPIWLEQIHGKQVVSACVKNLLSCADASYSFTKGQVCVVMTADCLPVVFYNKKNQAIAAAHAGWRGLAAGVLIETLKALGEGEIYAWMGPAIGADYFEVGEEVMDTFIDLDSRHSDAFIANKNVTNKWFANLYQLARQQLKQAGVKKVSGGEYCTYRDKERFYSYRRQHETGRMATLIWYSD